MRILVIASFFPYPLTSGGYIRLYNLLKQLSVKHEITLICEKRSKQQVKQEYIKTMEKICKKIIVVDAAKQWSPKNIAKAGYSAYPFLLIGHTIPAMKEAIVEVLKEKRFDVIHVETFYVFQNLPKTYLPTVLVEHNIEYEVYKKYAMQASIFIRPLLMVDIWKMKYWEEKFWRKATEVVAVSEKDQQKMLPVHATVVPNGVDMEKFPFAKKKTTKEKRVLFMGDFKWVQNRDTAKWILQEIWPKLQTKLVDKKIILWIVGKNIPENIKEIGGKNVIFDEHAPDETAKIYEKSYLLLAPIKVGGGTSYKILEAMASGVPVVTTNLGVQGLGAKHQKEALVAETAEELARQVVLLFEKKDVYEKITKNARKLIEEKYTWKSITQTLEMVYNKACNV